MNKIKTFLKNRISHGIKYVPFLIVAILVGVTVAYAQVNKLIPSGDNKTDQMYSLTDIYNLTQGDEADARTGDITPTPDNIESTTIPTLTEVYEAVATAMENVVTPPTFAPTDITSYNCSWFTNMTDPTQDPSPTSAQICGWNNGCTWNEDTSECDGGAVTSLSLGNGETDPLYMTWYAGKEACALSTAQGETAGTWRLPTSLELHKLYLDNSGTPDTFQSGGYWSGITVPAEASFAYGVGMVDGNVGVGSKDNGILVRCAH